MTKVKAISKRSFKSVAKSFGVANLVVLGVIIIISIVAVVALSIDADVNIVDFSGNLVEFSIDGEGFSVGIGNIGLGLLIVELVLISFFLLFTPMAYIMELLDTGLRLGVSRKTIITITSIMFLVIPVLTTILQAIITAFANGAIGEFWSYVTVSKYVGDLFAVLVIALLTLLYYRIGHKIFIGLAILPGLDILMELLIFVLPTNLVNSFMNFYDTYQIFFSLAAVLIAYGVYFVSVKRTSLKVA